MGKVINVKIESKIATAEENAVYVCYNSDYEIHFSFDDEWAEFSTKTAMFVYNGKPVPVVFEGNICPIPIIKNSLAIQVGVFAGNLHTTTPALISARKSILCEGGTPADPPDDVYNQIMERLNELGTPDPEAIAAAVADYIAANQIEEKDPTVPDWAKTEKKPEYTAKEVGAVSETELQTAINNALAQAVDDTLTKSGKAADAKATGDAISALSEEKVNCPVDDGGKIQNGISGQILQTNGDGTTQWVDKPEGSTTGPTDEQVSAAVSEWLAANPDATTTVQDGSITMAKTTFVNSKNILAYQFAESESITIKSVDDVPSEIIYLYEGNQQYNWYIRLNYYNNLAYSTQRLFLTTGDGYPGTLLYSSVKNGIYQRIIKADISSFLDTYRENVENGMGASELTLDFANTAATKTAYVLTEYSEELLPDILEKNFEIVNVSEEFVNAVQLANEVANANKAEPDYSALSGKYAIHIGDSYTVQMASLLETFDTGLGMAGALNHGIVSSTIRDSDGTGYANHPMVCRVCNISSLDATGNTLVGDVVPLDRDDIGLITFMGGTNDSYGYESSIGTDPLDGSQAHIYGAMYMILEKLTTAYPSVPIIVILQPPRADITITESPEGVDVTNLSQSLRGVLVSQRKQSVVRDVAQLFASKNVHIVDCCFDWYSPLNTADLSEYWGSDLLHLTSDGYGEIINGSAFDSLAKKVAEIFT